MSRLVHLLPTASRLRLGGLGVASAGLFLAAASPAWAEPPTGDFTISPAVGTIGEPVTFTPQDLKDPDVIGQLLGIDSVSWQFDNNGEFVTDEIPPFDAQHTYTTAGNKYVTMRIKDADGEVTDVPHILRVNRPPSAGIAHSPDVPDVGENVVLSGAGSSDDQAIPNSGFDWDLDGDGRYDDATGRTVSVSFRSTGDKTVRLRVTDSDGARDTATEAIHVNLAPEAALVYSPKSPVTDQEIDFTSISGDPDGPISAEAWDLDGDGRYDDATGRTASRSFALAGKHTVRLKVWDDHGRTDVTSVDVSVAPKAQPKVERIRPWPVIRIVGFAGSHRTRIDLLSVRTVAGATVKIRCRGEGCPRRRATSTRSTGKLVRARWLERRLRIGTRIAVAVSMPGHIGRYTVFKLRKRKKPLRREMCLYPGQGKATRCGS